ncbi:hypothetical protein KBC86_00680 [Candidatus Gracilibacteria bacterium]|nr:hypothetical protein [Candidatus Gracilibacteria bacterium]
MSKNHDAWDSIFDNLAILEGVDRVGYFDISADDIKKYGKREPRLMTKIDYEEVTPTIMKDHGLSILAISNGVYRIARTNPFMKIAPLMEGNISKVKPRKDIATINPFSISTESQILDVCSVNGILDTVFGESADLTIRGRIRVDSDIGFRLGDIRYDISGVQVEVDGGYEGASSINLIEAKMGGRSNLSIRQLVYPELFWRSRIEDKVVRSYVLLYERNVIRFIPFFILSDGQYILDSDGEKQFQFIHPEAEKFELSKVPVIKNLLNHDAPFPQADDFDKVVSMFLYVAGGYTSKEELSKEFDIVNRQIDYYYSVLSFLGLCIYERGDDIFLTERGEKLSKLSKDELLIELAKIIFSSKIFHDALRGGIDDVDEKDFEVWKISGSTIKRRLQTVNAWIKYFKENLIN